MLNQKVSSFVGRSTHRYFLNTPIPYLENCFGIVISPCFFIRSAVIDTSEKKSDLLQLASEMLTSAGFSKQKRRLASIQLNTLEKEWELIQLQHLCLYEEQNDFQIAHISLPTEPLLYKKDPQGPSEFTQKALAKLLKNFNAEAWIIYCKWLSEEIEQVLAAFKPEDSEEYQLQARLEDFLHEVHSSLLAQLQQEMATERTAQKEALSKNHPNEIYASEAAMAKKRERLALLLQNQTYLLEEIINGIVKIEEMHPELSALRLTATVLQALICGVSCGQAILLLQLLNAELGVISAVNCDDGLFRTNLAFAIQLALIESHFSGFKALEFCLKWGKEEGEQAKKFQERVWKNCERFNLRGKREINLPSGDSLNLQLADFLPLIPTIQNRNQSKQIVLFVVDPKTHHRKECTSIGQKLLLRRGLIS